MDSHFLEQVALHKQLSKQIEELEEQKKVLGVQILERMQENTVKLPGFIVRCCKRLLIKTSLERARQLGAIKMEEMVDKEKIKELIHTGIAVDDVSEIQYIQISETNPPHD